MAIAAKTPKAQTGVSLDVEVLKYLDHVASSDDRDRSYIINRIIREHAERNGTPIPVKHKEPGRVRQGQ
jgi:metal-responsive CopG/Arc/MetJ family transcriptional regulator